MAESLCISIRSFNRPHYLEREINSLLYNTDLDVDFLFIQDGPVNPISGKRYAKDEEIQQCISLINKCDLPNKTLIVRKENGGNLGSKKIQMEMLFPKYDYLMLIDDDLEFNKYYIKTLKTLFKQFNNDPRAGMLQTSFMYTGNNLQSEEDAFKLENKVSFGFSHRCEQGFWRHSLENILPIFKKYLSWMGGADFNEFFKDRLSYPVRRKNILKAYNGAFADDHVLEESTRQAGYLGVHTLSSRFRIIGEKGGYTFDGGRWKTQAFDKVKLHDVGNVDLYEAID